ncbi:hypothetical protein F5B22DRAFT_642127 [Xylaria bambusicola]|uniref:uncharacterized protein n=1 Tax=Xylaria bambusicola TaxID=326684 RepID=UPI0020078233|nr:uncharacterized protein F5B22DRAFT_642127 [Xylaria bambusicola]KAI0525969.1 hypothetical protein F5B22DRAFT_642127 [Xylaria bambusicola]
MTTSGQNLPTATEHQGEEPATARQSSASPVERADEPAPPLPQRPAPSNAQPLPPSFQNQTQPAYVPFTGQPTQQLPYATPVRPLPHQSSAYLATRLGLIVFSSIWGIIIIALTSILLSEGTAAASVSVYAYAIVVISIIWNTAELITYCVRLRKEVQRGIHPGAHVGLHLLFWLAGIFATLVSIPLYLVVASEVDRCANGKDEHYYYYSHSYCDEYQPYDYYQGNVLPTFRAFVAIFVLWTINHFVLFVLACIETHKRNSMRPAAFIMPVQAPTAAPVQGMYYPQAAGMQPQPMQYYPYPVVMQHPSQPQPVHLSGAESRTQAMNEKQPAQPYQNLTGFYAPAAVQSNSSRAASA